MSSNMSQMFQRACGNSRLNAETSTFLELLLEHWLVISSPKIYHGINQVVVRDPTVTSTVGCDLGTN